MSRKRLEGRGKGIKEDATSDLGSVGKKKLKRKDY